MNTIRTTEHFQVSSTNTRLLNATSCLICSEQYNENCNIPMCFSCGHTICRECLYKCDYTCPFCMRYCSSSKNFALIDLISATGKSGRCLSHNNEAKIICITHETLLCGVCILKNSKHKNCYCCDYEDLNKLVVEKMERQKKFLKSYQDSKESGQEYCKEKKEELMNLLKQKFPTNEKFKEDLLHYFDDEMNNLYQEIEENQIKRPFARDAKDYDIFLNDQNLLKGLEILKNNFIPRFPDICGYVDIQLQMIKARLSELNFTIQMEKFLSKLENPNFDKTYTIEEIRFTPKTSQEESLDEFCHAEEEQTQKDLDIKKMMKEMKKKSKQIQKKLEVTLSTIRNEQIKSHENFELTNKKKINDFKRAEPKFIVKKF